MTKRCTVCGFEQDFAEFGWQNEEKGYVQSWCRTCKNAKAKARRDANLEKMRAYHREWSRLNRKKDVTAILRHEKRRRCKKYGVTEQWLHEQTEKQNSVCALCLKPEISRSRKGGAIRSLAIDHSHTDGTARGLLCSACNQAVGKIEGSPGWIERAIEYLKKE